MRERGCESIKQGGTAGKMKLSSCPGIKVLMWDRASFVIKTVVPNKKKGDTTMSNTEIPYKIYLEEQEMPKAWYNMRADMKNKPAPLLNPGTHQPMTAEELGGVFCEELVK